MDGIQILMKDEPEKYQTHFFDYIKAGAEPDTIEEVYKKVHAAIRADSTPKKAEKQPPKAQEDGPARRRGRQQTDAIFDLTEAYFSFKTLDVKRMLLRPGKKAVSHIYRDSRIGPYLLTLKEVQLRIAFYSKHVFKQCQCTRHPEIKWAQREDKVYITVVLADTKKVNLAPECVFSFSATAGQHAYDLKLELADKVNVDESKINIGERSIFCILEKAEPKWWNKLLKGDAKTPNYVKVDWDKWVDEDDEAGPATNLDMGGMDFSV
ncbi:putative HSP20-like chaperone [Tanacetum coccineum]